MKDLIKFEMIKIFQRKIIYIIAVLIAIVMLMNPIKNYFKIKSTFGGVEELKKISRKYEGDITLEKQIKFNNDIEKIASKLSHNEKLTKEEAAQYYYLIGYARYKYLTNKGLKYSINNKQYTLDEIRQKLKVLDKNSYEFKDFKKVETMLSSKHGKGKLITSKILATMLYCLIVFGFTTILFFLSGLHLGVDGYKAPLNSISYATSAPYNITIIKYYVLCLLFSLMGTLALGLIIALISLLTKNSMITLLLGLGAFYGITLLSEFNMPMKCMNIVSELSISSLIRAKDIFLYYNSYNIFGTPVLYPTVMMIRALITIPFLLFAVKFLGKRQQV